MPFEYSFIIDGEVVEKNTLSDRLFYFDFDMFRRYAERVAGVSLQAIIGEYKNRLAKMWFRQADVDHALVDEEGPPSQREEKQGTAKEQITAWQALLPRLNGAELIAAKLAIAKWEGKTHGEAFEAVRPGESIGDTVGFVSKKKNTAKTVVDRYGYEYALRMPEWKVK